MSNQPKRRALGRGLAALLPAAKEGAANESENKISVPRPPVQSPRPGGLRPGLRSTRTFFKAPIEEIYPHRDQPRKHFPEAELDELAQSIKVHGVIQPLIVRNRKEGGYWLIAGERRWRACQRAGMHDVPVVVQEVSEREAFERALVENLQRSDLNAIEEAEAYSRLVTQYDYTQEQLAARVGKERSTVANSLRLLKLPPVVRGLVEEGKLSMGHARALLALDSVPDIETVARTVVAKALSVRATEKLVRSRTSKPTPAASPRTKSASVRDVENRLTKSLGAQVMLKEDRKGRGGELTIRYGNLDDLDRLLARLLS